MKISYGRQMWDKNGTYYDQRIAVTKLEFTKLQKAIQAEMEMGFPTRARYSSGTLEDLKHYFKNLQADKVKFPYMQKEQTICFLTLTQMRFLSRFTEIKDRLKMDRNAYIEIV